MSINKKYDIDKLKRLIELQERYIDQLTKNK